jgi:polyisoprenoid-binding protein YceI
VNGTAAPSSAPAWIASADGETRRAFSATTTIARKDYGLTWNKLVDATPAVGDEIVITLDVEAVQEAPKTAAR